MKKFVVAAVVLAVLYGAVGAFVAPAAKASLSAAAAERAAKLEQAEKQ